MTASDASKPGRSIGNDDEAKEGIKLLRIQELSWDDWDGVCTVETRQISVGLCSVEALPVEPARIHCRGCATRICAVTVPVRTVHLDIETLNPPKVFFTRLSHSTSRHGFVQLSALGSSSKVVTQ